MLKKILKVPKINRLQIRLFLLFFLALFLVFNIVSSQLISPTYFGLVEGGRKNTVVFLKSIRSLPEFETELKKYQDTYGEDIKEDVFEQENAQNRKIKNFEQTLERNTYSRDILYSLYLLHKQKGEDSTAETYLKQVREIDPTF